MDKIRTCKTCGESNAVVRFYVGVTSRCAECYKAMVRVNRLAKHDYYAAYDAERYKNNLQRRAANKAYAKTDAGKASAIKSKQRWRTEYPERRAAQIALGNAIRDGKIVKPNNCSVCGTEAEIRLEGHHYDYTKPLDVIWCCTKCHSAIHRQAA